MQCHVSNGMTQSSVFYISLIILNIGIVRGHPTSLKYIDMNDGYSVLLRAMQSSVEKLQIKSAFLLSSLCSRNNSNDIKYTLVKMGFIEQAAGLLSRMNLQPTVR